MHFSCKISNAVINILEEQGEDLSSLYEQSPTPMELLRDSSYWISAPDMEQFLDVILKLPLKKEDNILVRAGHEGPQLRAWGVLDSVLRMMPHPQEIFNQPEHFLSYFMSPKPPIENLRRDKSSISFDLPLPAEQYPLVTTYLKAAFESLPVYVGQPAAVCNWEGISIKLNWSVHQDSIFSENVGHQVSPTLFKSLIEDLQRTQREREDLQKYVRDLEEKVIVIEKQNKQLQASADVSTVPDAQPKASLFTHEASLSHLSFDVESPAYLLNQNLARLHDYMVRAQQLITMLVAQDKQTPSVKAAMKRVDWEFVKTQYPRTVFESMDIVKKTLHNHSEDKDNKEGKHHV